MPVDRSGQFPRRQFLRTAGGLALGAGIVRVAGAWAQTDPPAATAARPALRQLGRTGLLVTDISFGGIQIQHERLLDVAIDRGINLVHTAPGYGGGRSMQLFGKVMKRRRNEVVLALKQSPVAGVDAELRALQTDHVDLLVPPLHSVAEVDDPRLPEAFARLKQQGKIRFSGYACHSSMAAVVSRSVALGYFDVMLVAYNLANRDELNPILARARTEQDMGVMAMKATKDVQPGGHAAAFRGLLANPDVHTLLVGMATFADVEANVAATARPSGWLDRLHLRQYEHLAVTACALCGACTVCPQGIPVADVLRCGLYLDRGERELAEREYRSLAGTRPERCDDCGKCEASCPRGRPVRAQLRQVRSALA